MPLNGGEFIRDRDLKEREKSINEKLFALYSAIRIENNHPSTVRRLDDVYFWRGERLENVKQALEEMAVLTAENGVSEIESPFNVNEKINLADFIAKAKRSITYSEQIAEQLRNQPPETMEESAKRRAAMKRRLRLMSEE
jgi:hypothetical protein